MEEHHSKPKRKFQLPAQIAPLGFLWKQLTRDREAFRILIACTLAMVTTGLEPAFLTLSTPEIQNRLRAPDTHAPMFIGLGFLIFAVLTLVAGTTGDLFGRKRVMVIGLAVLTLANALGGLAFGTPLFVLADVLATIAVLAVLPMCIATMTLIYPLEVRPLAYGLLFGSLFTAIIVGASLGGLFDALGYPAVSFLPVVVVGVYALRQVTRHVPESRAPKEFRRANVVVNLLLLAGVFVLVFLVIVARSYLESWLPVLVAALALLLLVLGVRWLRGRVRFFKGVEMFTGRDTGFAIVAGIVLFIAEGAFLYQFTAFFQNVWDMGAALAGISFTPFLIGLLPGTFLVARPGLTVRGAAHHRRGPCDHGGQPGVAVLYPAGVIVLVPARTHDPARFWVRAGHTCPDAGGPICAAGGPDRLGCGHQHRFRPVGLCPGGGHFQHAGHAAGGHCLPGAPGECGPAGNDAGADQANTSGRPPAYGVGRAIRRCRRQYWTWPRPGMTRPSPPGWGRCSLFWPC